MPIPGTQTVTGKIAPSDASDTYATHEDIYGKGGYQVIETAADRDLIPTERRKEGMLVYDKQYGLLWKLEGGVTNSDWSLSAGNNAGVVADYATLLSSIPAASLPFGAVYTTGDDGRQYWWDGDDWFPIKNGEYHVVLDEAAIVALPSHLKKDGELYFSQTDRHEYRMSGITPIRESPWDVRTFAELQTACASATQNTITLRADITITSNITIPAGKQVLFNGYKFIRSGTPTIQFDGGILDARVQLFDGWSTPGLIYGQFAGCDAKYPEWWGLDDGSSGDPILTGQHQVAINCALRTWPNPSSTDNGNIGHPVFVRSNVVSLRTGAYYTSAPIDMRGSYHWLKGTPGAHSYIFATADWDQSTYENSRYWSANRATNTPDSHTAMIWFGGGPYGGGRFRTGIEGVNLVGTKGMMIANQYEQDNPGSIKKFSCIGISASSEEQTFIRDCAITHYNGGGICFDGDGSGLNGLEISNIWFFGGVVGEDASPIIFNRPTYNVIIRNCTMAGYLTHANSQYWNQSFPSVGQFYLNEIPADSEIVTIGSTVYTFNSVLGGAYSVLIGASIDDCVDNLMAAINAGPGSGTLYGVGTAAHPNYTAVYNDSVRWGGWFRIYNKVAGTAGNGTATTSSMTHSGWVAATTTGGVNAAANAPEYITYTPAKHAIVIRDGGVNIQNLHIEGFLIPILIDLYDGLDEVTVSNIDAYIPISYKQRWQAVPGVAADYINTYRGPAPDLATQRALATADGDEEWSCILKWPSIVVIMGQNGTQIRGSLKGNVTLTNIKIRNPNDTFCYLVRDWYTGVHCTAQGYGGTPLTSQGCLNFYSRTGVYAKTPSLLKYPKWPSTGPSANMTTPIDNITGDRVHFLGPIFDGF